MTLTTLPPATDDRPTTEPARRPRTARTPVVLGWVGAALALTLAVVLALSVLRADPASTPAAPVTAGQRPSASAVDQADAQRCDPAALGSVAAIERRVELTGSPCLSTAP